MSMKSYNFADGVQCIVGPVSLGGYSDDGGVVIEKVEAHATMTVGADGEATVSRTANRSATAVVTLKQTSESNAYLQSLLAAQELDATGTAYNVPFLLVDDSTGERISSPHTVVEGPPSRGFNKEAGDREWTLLLDNVSEVAAGASSLIDTLFTV